MFVQREVDREEVKKAIARLKWSKTTCTSIDGITSNMLKYGGDVEVEWMLLICDLAWRQRSIR